MWFIESFLFNRKNSCVFCFAFILFTGTTPHTFAQSAEKLFKSGLQMYKNAEYFKALDLFDKAECLYINESNSVGRFEALNKKVELLIVTDQDSKAVELMLSVRTVILSTLGENHPTYIDFIENLGKAYEMMSDIGVSKDYYDKAISLANNLYGDKDARTGHLYRHLASFYQFKRSYDSARFYAFKSLRICEADTVHQQEINFEEVIIEYGFSYKTKPGKYERTDFKLLDSAAIIFRRAASIARRKYPKGSWQEAKALHQVGNTFTDKVLRLLPEEKFLVEYYDSARYYYFMDLKLKERLLGPVNTEVAITYYTLGLVELYFRKSTENINIISYFDKALAALTPGFDSRKAHTIPDFEKSIDPYFLSTILGMKCVVYKTNFQNFKNENDLEEYYQIEKTRLRIWDKIIFQLQSPDANKIVRLWNYDFFGELIWACIEKYSLHPDENLLKEAFITTEKSKNALLLKSILESQILERSKDPVTLMKQQLKGFRAYTLQELQQGLLDSTSALLEYFDSKQSASEDNYAFLLTRDSLKMIQLPANAEFDSLLNRFNNTVTSFRVNEYEDASFSIYSHFVLPLLKNLPARIHKLIISPQGRLQKIPFEGLVTRKGVNAEDFSKLHYLLNDYVVSYAYSGTIGMLSSKEISCSDQTMFGCAPYFSKQSDLPFSMDLLRSLSSEVRGNFYFGSSAVSDQFRRNARTASLIHLSTHSTSNFSSSDSSRIYFSDQQIDSASYISLAEIYPLKLSADLAVLSSCETAIGEDSYGEGTISFARAFTYAGCKSTITTLWKVDDKATADLLRIFYSYLLRGVNREDALRNAKLDFLAQNRNSEIASPFYWSGLVLTGAGGPISLQKKIGLSTYLVLALCIIGCISIILVKIKRK